MALLTLAILGNAIIAVNAMSLTERMKLADEVFAHQPNVLASVVVLPRMGASMAQIDVPVHIMLVAWQAMKTSGHTWPVISEDIQEICLQRLTARARFAEGLAEPLQQQATQQYTDGHAEQNLLAFAFGYLGENDLLGVRTEAEKYVLLAALNIAECIAFVSAQARPAPATR